MAQNLNCSCLYGEKQCELSSRISFLSCEGNEGKKAKVFSHIRNLDGDGEKTRIYDENCSLRKCRAFLENFNGMS